MPKKHRNVVRINTYLFATLIGMLIATTAFYFFEDNITDLLDDLGKKEEVSQDFDNFIYSCSLGDLSDSMYCVNDRVRDFYVYNLTDDNIKLTFEELKTRGGDCKDWSDFYADVASRMGFDYDLVVIRIQGLEYHQFAVIHDSTGYCIMDNASTRCFSFNRE